MEGRKRKRAGHHTACWECHRLHRSCDGGRPCRRCVENAKGTSCRSLPRKPYSRRKTGDQWVNQRTLFLSISETTNNISPPIQSPSTPPSTPPSTNIFAATPTAKEKKQQLLVELINQIKQVQVMTQSLHMRQELLSEQLSTIQSQGPSAENSYLICPYSYFGTESEDQCECADSYSPSNSPSAFFFDEDSIPCYDLNPLTQSSTYVPSSNTQQDMLDQAEISRYPNQDEALPFPYPPLNDAERFKESLFLPFAIKDATKPFYVFKPIVLNWERFIHYPHKAQNCGCRSDPDLVVCTILSANSAFCTMSQYLEEELVGESLHKILPPTHNIRDEGNKKLFRFLKPQPPNVHVSEVISRRAEYVTKDGTLLAGMGDVQLFYNEGQLSFGVVAMLDFDLLETSPTASLPPSPISTPPDTPSSFFSHDALYDEAEGCCSPEAHSHSEWWK